MHDEDHDDIRSFDEKHPWVGKAVETATEWTVYAVFIGTIYSAFWFSILFGAGLVCGILAAAMVGRLHAYLRRTNAEDRVNEALEKGEIAAAIGPESE